MGSYLGKSLFRQLRGEWGRAYITSLQQLYAAGPSEASITEHSATNALFVLSLLLLRRLSEKRTSLGLYYIANTFSTAYVQGTDATSGLYHVLHQIVSEKGFEPAAGVDTAIIPRRLEGYAFIDPVRPRYAEWKKRLS